MSVGATSNTAAGYAALTNDTQGISNTAFGTVALGTNTTGRANTAVGFESLLDIRVAFAPLLLNEVRRQQAELEAQEHELREVQEQLAQLSSLVRAAKTSSESGANREAR